MGKPSNTRLRESQSGSTVLSRHTSNTTASSSRGSKVSLHSNMSANKRDNFNKRMKKKQRKSIQRLFEKLRDQHSTIAEQSSINDSVVLIEDSPNVKRKASSDNINPKAKIRKSNSLSNLASINNDFIPIKTTGFSTNSSPIRNNQSPVCSTPLSKKNKSQDNLNISDISVSANSLRSGKLECNKSFLKDVTDLTRQINRDSYVTIDLTTDSNDTGKNKSINNNTIIDLANEQNNSDCTFVSASSSHTSLSMSGDSQVTVINTAKRKKGDKVQKIYHEGIAKLNASEKGRLLDIITQNIFNGCKMVPKQSGVDVKASVNRATDTIEDTYIKEVILGQTPSRNSIGSNIYNPERDDKFKKGLRMIIIDGSNVALGHGKGQVFSVRGLKICIDYFLKRGHVVKAFVPRFRCKYGKSSEPRLLDVLERQGVVVYTPSREVQGRLICSYDDRYIVQCAAEFDGVIVSGDNYRDLLLENPRWRYIIENRLLMYTWVNDMIMFPRDPLGRYGPTLEKLLTHSD